MANMIQFDGFDGQGRKPSAACLAWEETLTDAVDGTLSPADQFVFERHLATCQTCSDKYADAQRGAAWLEMLKSPRPEPSADLIGRILAQTSAKAGAQTLASSSIPAAEHDYSGDVWNTGVTPFLVPTHIAIPANAVVASGNILPFRPRPSSMRSFGRVLLEPRLAMTAAMAFFSIALTLNLLGVRLNELHASDLKPDNLRRSFYTTNAQAIRYVDGLRVVHVMESRVDDLRQQNEDRALRQREPAPQPQPKPLNQNNEKNTGKPEPGQGTSRRETPVADKPRYLLSNAASAGRQDRKQGAFVTVGRSTVSHTGGWA